MPEVRAIMSFFDVGGKSVRNAGVEFYCEDERARKLASSGLVEILGLPAETEPEPEPAQEQEAEEAPKPKRKKKA